MTQVDHKEDVSAFLKGPCLIGRLKRQRSAAHIWIKLRNGEIIADVRNFPPLTPKTDRGSEATEAIARFIAAAPALYTALDKTARNLHSLVGSYHPEVKFEDCNHWQCVDNRAALTLAAESR